MIICIDYGCTVSLCVRVYGLILVGRLKGIKSKNFNLSAIAALQIIFHVIRVVAKLSLQPQVRV
jgi:hypothetical protein